MFKFIILLKRFIPPSRTYLFLTLMFNLLTTFYSLFCFAAVIPLLNMLFNTTEALRTYQVWTWDDKFKVIVSGIQNNLSYSVQQFIALVGPSAALLYIGLFLVIMTALKVGTAYLGAHFLIPIRTGVLRDLRNQLYKKIISLPIGFFTAERKGDIMSRMTGDVTEVEASIMSSLDLVFKNPILIIGYLTVMFVMSLKLTLFVLVLLDRKSTRL